MRKGIFTALLFTITVALYSLYLANDKCVHKSDIKSLLLENIEALAADEGGEGTGGIIRCIGVGCLDCPLTHEKVKYVIEGYSL